MRNDVELFENYVAKGHMWMFPMCLSRSTHKEFLNLKIFYWLDPRHKDKKRATKQCWSYCHTTSTQEDSGPPLIQNLVLSCELSCDHKEEGTWQQPVNTTHSMKEDIEERRKHKQAWLIGHILFQVIICGVLTRVVAFPPHTQRVLLIKIEQVSYLLWPDHSWSWLSGHRMVLWDIR